MVKMKIVEKLKSKGGSWVAKGGRKQTVAQKLPDFVISPRTMAKTKLRIVNPIHIDNDEKQVIFAIRHRARVTSMTEMLGIAFRSESRNVVSDKEATIFIPNFSPMCAVMTIA